MDSQSTIANFSRGATRPRDHTTHRRAYLDTYARRRAGLSDQAPEELDIPVAVVEQTAVVAQPQLVAPAIQRPQVIAIPIQQPAVQTEADYMQPQPAADSFSYTSIAPAELLPSSNAPKHSDPQRSYLDTLTKRHAAAVAQAPAAEETVIQPTLSTETQTLFDDPVKEARLEANLRALYSDSLTSKLTTDTKSASTAHMRTIIASAFACGVMAVGIFTFMGRFDSHPVVAQPIGSPVIEVESGATTPKDAPAVTGSVNQVAADPEHPVRMVISSIGVNAPVEGLGTTPEGLIAVPKSYGVVGWYNKGSVPGKAGPAVLVGHYTGGNGGVFDKLKDLKDGDLITTTNGKGQSFTYRVSAKNEYEKDKVPMAQLFKSSKESRLEIITCSGKWQAKNYDKRLVITAELVK